jgi:hypothetical protein
MRTIPTAHLVLPVDRTHLDTDTSPLALGVLRHKSPSVGEIGEHPTTGAINTKYGAGSTFLKKRVGHMKVQERKKRKKRSWTHEGPRKK